MTVCCTQVPPVGFSVKIQNSEVAPDEFLPPNMNNSPVGVSTLSAERHSI
eukprot:CAMPEP_0114567160 /NCGR_PEP_ID=MMETSP0114-20121206/15318_1 /TAXON_ID=31324 /ORGANISM="Goniomonas sp, Strain m" /LENGTH=49 /DNA_ID=CAMNT_0001753701 /DNA_START=61 /DNA_END=210 /DNA_ORIENTATION=+